MRPIRRQRATALHCVRAAMLAVALLVAVGCHSTPDPNAEPEEHFDPVLIHIKNENFLDMNIAVNGNGVSRRLGTVPGNSSGDFTVPFSVGNGSGLSLTATPIGGRGSLTTRSLSVGQGQIVDFRIAPLLNQSVATVHEPN